MGLTKKQLEVYDFIKQYHQQEGLAPTQAEIKDHFGFKSYGSVQRYIKYLTEAGMLTSGWNERRGLTPTTDMQESEFEIPLLGLVAAGDPILALENPTETVSVPTTMLAPPHRYFGLTVQGESMIEAGILEGDTLICRQQSSAQQGEIVVAVVEGEATVKKFYRHPDHIELQPANASYSPILVDGGQFQLAGVVAGLLRSYN
ncbi:MAG: transcriptional repressor LexA [Bdellovibrionales bacterium]|jgi:repressor LexA|nr:transcriptional repressor LexA [Bdellovibrionales bacterium]MBT3525042.1 transcriptional repressor LexA [Bdellovibrionales bacterium]MBT7767732.1 transcriptional repressor LexA [Bdellovibrionales bacterium]